MSHNTYSVLGETQSRDSSIAGATIKERIFISCGGVNDAYTNSGATTLDNTTLYFYDDAPTNAISGATITSSNDWISSVTLPAGTYQLKAAFSVVFTASGQFAYQWFDGTNSIGNRAQIGATIQFNTESAACLAQATVTITSSTTFSIKSSSGSTNLDSIANQGDRPSEESYIMIRKF